MLRKTSTLIFAIAAIAVAVGSMLWLNGNAKHSGSNSAEIGTEGLPVEPKMDTLGAQWNWDKVQARLEKTRPANQDNDQKDSALTYPYNSEEIYNALQQIQLDGQGNILVNHVLLWSVTALVTLELSQQDITDLKELITLGLPGIAGEQTADLAGKYYEFLVAKKEFEETLPTENNVDNHKKQLQEIAALREMYLGTETSQKLFAKSDADATFMADAMALHGNTELSETQKKEAIRKINENYINQTINALNLTEKYELFRLRKTEILADGSDEESRQQAISDAMQEIFNRRELTEIAHLPLTVYR